MELFGVSYTVILVSLSALLGLVHFTCFVVVLAICMIFLQVPSHMVLGILSFRWFFAQHQW